ncbi:hypothetical protein [Roseivivax sp. THAF40]|uniref:hypothetical protein n=1 Tax=Roseivivax sp. THAF40 TaxID=2587858 RepID=UPI0012683CD7|nr:hypothetical protein [Roseivivax sp. THAF40]
MDFGKIADPTEVFEAADGDASALVDLLRSKGPLSRRTRNALASWLSGEFDAEPKVRGRAPNRGLNVSALKLEMAKVHYHSVRQRRGRRSTSERVLIAVAQRYGLAPDYFRNQLRRAQPRSAKPNPLSEARAFREWQQQKRRTK